jgi:hypothetical protein
VSRKGKKGGEERRPRAEMGREGKKDEKLKEK